MAGLLHIESAGIAWYWLISVIAAPLWIAATLTTIAVIGWRRAYRSAGRPPMDARHLMCGTILLGGLLGGLTQWCSGELITALTGVPIADRLALLAASTTGLLSMGGYEALRWWLGNRRGTKWRRALEFISVRHRGQMDDTLAGPVSAEDLHAE